MSNPVTTANSAFPELLTEADMPIPSKVAAHIIWRDNEIMRLQSALTDMEARALRAEDACDKDGKARAEAGGMEMEMEIQDLRSALTASEKDAARYRAIRSEEFDVAVLFELSGRAATGDCDCYGYFESFLAGDEMDEIVDNQIGKASGT